MLARTRTGQFCHESSEPPNPLTAICAIISGPSTHAIHGLDIITVHLAQIKAPQYFIWLPSNVGRVYQNVPRNKVKKVQQVRLLTLRPTH